MHTTRPLASRHLFAPACLGALLLTPAAFAQSNVTIYGLLDAGVTWTDNVRGQSMTRLDTGAAQGNRLGFRGSEDLGGGLRAVFTLENGFNLDDGTLGQGGRIFGRTAAVGLSGPWGTLTGGRQYDPLYDALVRFAIGSNLPAGTLAWSLPTYAVGGSSLNNRILGVALDNTVKYASPTVGGFDLRLSHSFGEVGGSSTTNSSQGFSVSYANGPFSAGVAGFYGRNASPTLGHLKELAAGASYKAGAWTVFSNITKVAFAAGARTRATTLEIGTTYAVQPAVVLGAGLQAQDRNNRLNGAEQLTLSVDYLLSRRTDAYVVMASGHDRQFNAQVVAPLANAAADTDRQSALRVGIRHRF